MPTMAIFRATQRFSRHANSDTVIQYDDNRDNSCERLQQDSPTYNNDFLYLGKNIEKFKSIFSEVGDVRVLQNLY